MSKRKIKNILINKKFQLKYILWLVIPTLIVTFSYSYLFYYFISENYQVLVDLNPVMSDEVKGILYQELNQLFYLIFAISILFTFFIIVIALVNSNKTAGPLYRLKKEFDKIKKGNFSSKMKLRPNDDFQDVAQSFNDMIDSIKSELK